MVSEGLRTLLATDYDVAGVVGDGQDVVPAVREHAPDVLLLDLSLPHRTGMDLLSDLRGVTPMPRVIIVTMHVDHALVDAALALGAAAFVPKDAPVAELRSAIEEVLAGRRYVSALVRRRGPHVRRRAFDRLTTRQQEIVRMVGRGLTEQEMAAELGLTVHTVRFHRRNVRQQLGLATEWALVRYAILVELAEAPPEQA